MRKGERFDENGPEKEATSGPKYEGQIEFDLDEITDEWLAVRRLIALGTATFESGVDKDGKKSVTVRDKVTGKVIFFSDMEFLKTAEGNPREQGETLGN